MRYDGRLSDELCAEACVQTGVHPSAFRTLFQTDDALYERVVGSLDEECRLRLRAAVAEFTTEADASDHEGLVAAAACLVRARPLDRSSLMIRSERRLAALRSPGGGEMITEADRRLVAASIDTFEVLVSKLGRRFLWPPRLAVRIIFDSYERSFEAWILRGGDDNDFLSSRYARRTLPQMLEQMSSWDAKLISRGPRARGVPL